jgi:hypothetical protein
VATVFGYLQTATTTTTTTTTTCNKLDESAPSSILRERNGPNKRKLPILNTATTQTRQVNVTPVEHAAILRERIRLQEARQKA